MKVLFVSTRKNSSPDEHELYEMEFMNELLGFRRSLLDLGLITVAACTPADVEVEIVDEYVEAIPYDTTDADLVALSAKTSCVTHAYEVAARFQARGIPVVLGGIHASLRPDEALERVDFVVVGEAERAWPVFIEAFRRGQASRRTDANELPAMDEIPVPAWARLDSGEFLFHQIQTTRGCPFMCRFCSVPDISGNTFRCKPVEAVVAEVRALPRAGLLKDRMKALYFVDDNFISRVRYTKQLLRALAPLHASGELGEWSAETTLNVATDEELLDLFVAAGCSTLIIGFESIDQATLEAMDKKVNFCLTYQQAIARIHERGLSIVGNFIVGFDTDTLSVFREIMDFVDEHTILYPFFSILTPMPGTKLHEDFRAAGRLDHLDWARYDTRHVVFEPAQMSREQLLDGYIWMYNQAYGSRRALDRLERYWVRYRRRGSTRAEHAFIKWRLRRFKGRLSARLENLIADGWKRLHGVGHRDIGQLVYFWDSAHWTDWLDECRSANYDEHARMFVTGAQSPEGETRKQWHKQRLLRAGAGRA